MSFKDVVEEAPAPQEEEQQYSVYDYDESPANRSWAGALPVKQGLYDPELEKDACGVGFAAYVPYLATTLNGRALNRIQPHQGSGVTQDSLGR